MNKIILKASDLDGYLNETDRRLLEGMDTLYGKAMQSFKVLTGSLGDAQRKHTEELISVYNEMGARMQEICSAEPRIRVYSFKTPAENHGEASRLIAKLRDVNTQRNEFVYYTQRAYELLFNLAFGGVYSANKNYLIVRTPVTNPVQNFAVHKIPNIDEAIENSVMCVMLRGALLPSMIMSKEIEEFSSHAYVTPFALFKIKRDDRRDEQTMEYILDLDRSYFKPEQLDGKDLIFADPMNATGGSLVTVIKYILDQGVKPRSIKFFTIISALKGALRVARAIENMEVYTLWMDPVLNELAYIMPGLGDAGDRINGLDMESTPRDMIQLIADYGSNIANLYRSQIRVIEDTVLRR
ncbi:MAG: uracil phosphoribosyltransferase [Spirochaetes bacterium GWD1_61_31]|nr:MAG: uracil phosphoribosyltransferase [Spirochaetes bacterium GWB1_60_80]OHD34025.1 MAG: uracil phosphoribosyltransferase [Spirochaetes bacterium GWC1_61_12]OHD35200.1 MAG: uracil phosphoribosyltransferase [Spirochaetes bacterium GWD1_61_31]OHD41405.1 MAG: uracil phosphoribosyltransferase [Spirochaetes bacterium GWE1_60_18]OHD59202.1 MAG: uracil phosphoribosyltransferase [Spirochaetes bacterium GWF1_60_12]HAP43097.1 uracil phosphoribosyltransferase [Spirochaetaceae bacterium]